jgi:two-component system, chemotaxis family, protein-glutamate methylesterase/glutaminase
VRRWPPRTTPVRRLEPTGAARVVAIAASTGGPAALQRVLSGLPRDFPVPVLITQHIAPGFVEALVRWLGASCELRMELGRVGALPRAGTVHLAPDGVHMGIERGVIALSACGPAGGHCPSADFLFGSVARSHGASAVGVVLTGMGADGVVGLRAIHAAGGRVIAQDEESSVVFGMPREAQEAGVVHVVLPIEQIARQLVTLTRDRSE